MPGLVCYLFYRLCKKVLHTRYDLATIQWQQSFTIKHKLNYVRSAKIVLSMVKSIGRRAICVDLSEWYMLVYYGSHQKQPSRGVLRRSCSENIWQICTTAPMSKCDFNKVANQLYRNGTSAWVLFCKFTAYLHIICISTYFLHIFWAKSGSMSKTEEGITSS